MNAPRVAWCTQFEARLDSPTAREFGFIALNRLSRSAWRSYDRKFGPTWPTLPGPP